MLGLVLVSGLGKVGQGTKLVQTGGLLEVRMTDG